MARKLQFFFSLYRPVRVFLPHAFFSSVLMLFAFNLLFLLLSFVSFSPGTASAKCKETTKCKEISCAIAPWCSDICLNFALACLCFFTAVVLNLLCLPVSFAFMILQLVSLVLFIVDFN